MWPYNDVSTRNAQATLQSCSILNERPVNSPLIMCVCMRRCEDAGGSMTATSSDYHVAVLLQDHIGAVVKVEHRNGM